MAIQLGSAYGKVALDIAGLLSGVAKGKAGLLSLAKAGENVGAGMKRAGQMITVGVTLPILAVGAASIKAASDFEETKNKALVVFDEMADGVVANANRAATALGVSKTQYLDYASSIGAALKAGGMGVKQSAELAEEAVKHFADLASFHNGRVEDVALAWQSAIRGQYEPIQKYFPFINDAYMKTYGIANGMLDENTKTLTANQRAIILNAIALNEELNPALNDFAETSGGLANQARIMKARWNDALIMLGTNLLPVALMVVQALNRMLEAFNNLDPTQQKIVLGFMAFLAVLGPMLTVLGTLISTISTLLGVFSTLSTMGFTLGTVGTVITGTLVPAIGAVLTALAPVLIIIAAVALQIGILYLMWKFNFLGMRDNVVMWVAVVKNLWRALMAFLRGDTAAALEFLGEAFQAIKDRLAKVFDFGAIRDAFTSFVTFISTALGRIRDYIANVFTKTNWSQVGKFILFGIANGMLLGLPTLIVTAAKVADQVLNTIKTKLGIKSPSKAFEQLGVYSAQGYQLGLAKQMGAEDVARTMAKPVNQMSSSQQQNITMQFANGLTMRQVQGMIADNNETLIGQLNRALGAT